MELVVLAGGFGTRLAGVLNGKPKALASIDGVPFLLYQLQNWVSQGVKSFVFLLHHESDQIIQILDIQKSVILKHCNVHWIVEPKPMGTGGAIAYMCQKRELHGGFLVVNADTWVGGSIDRIMHSMAPSLAVKYVPDASRYGTVELGSNKCVTAFYEKRFKEEKSFINAGIYKLNSSFFENWDEKPFSLETKLMPQLASDGLLYYVKIEDDFIDIGEPNDFERFRAWIASGKKHKL